MNLADRVAWAIVKIQGDHRLSDPKLGNLLGTSKMTIFAYKKKGGLIKGELLEGMATQFNFNAIWLLKGLGEPFPGGRSRYPEVCGPEETPAAPADQVRDGPVIEYRRSLEVSPEFVYVPAVGGRISAGGGLAPDNTVEMRIAFRRDWITRKGDPRRMSLIRVSGDSMEPTLLSGDLVLVDHGRDYLDPQGGIYAISRNDAIMIKRLHLRGAAVQIISDNQRYGVEDAAMDEVKINGKVIWFGRELER